MKTLTTLVCLLLVTFIVAPVLAAPGLPVTKPPLWPVPSYTGPKIDPHALRGQWFNDPKYGHTVRPLEFHDNTAENGGGFADFLAIEGHVSTLYTDANQNITAFDIVASITNDMPGYGEWAELNNLHGEEPFYPREQYKGPMLRTKLTVEFADNGKQGDLPVGSPYLAEQNIYAIEYDQLAWYCWTPDNPNRELVPWGDYWVPTYDFGDILPGKTVSRTLSFGLYTAEAPGTYLYGFLQDAVRENWDVFMNRTTSLKISQYVDNILHDTGTPYPAGPRNSDVSVFFAPVPEPTTVSLLMFGGLAVLFYRRRRS